MYAAASVERDAPDAGAGRTAHGGPRRRVSGRICAQIQAISRALRALTRAVTTEATEILRASENHIAYCLGPSLRARVTYICPMPAYVRLGFDYGGSLEDPDALLQGAGKRMRHVKVATPAAAENPALARLLAAAWQDAATRLRPAP